MTYLKADPRITRREPLEVENIEQPHLWAAAHRRQLTAKLFSPNAHRADLCFTVFVERRWPNVRFGSLADISERTRNVRFTPQSRHSSARVARPLRAISGHLRTSID